jgi:carbon monoxide dehydrogenase subunit G
VLLRILGILVLVVGVILAVAAAKPARLKVERSIAIDAPAAKVFGLVNDFHNWKQWAPGDKDDPTSNRTYSGAGAGVGAVSNWRGNGNTNSARMEITGGAQDAQVIVTVDFSAPFVARNMNTFWIKAAGASGPTKVTWNFDGQNVFMMKVMGVFMNMDHFMGQHFEQGLQNLKTAAEK